MSSTIEDVMINVNDIMSTMAIFSTMEDILSMISRNDMLSTVGDVQYNKGSLHISLFTAVVDFSSKRYSGSTGHRNYRYQQRSLQ